MDYDIEKHRKEVKEELARAKRIFTLIQEQANLSNRIMARAAMMQQLSETIKLRAKPITETQFCY